MKAVAHQDGFGADSDLRRILSVEGDELFKAESSIPDFNVHSLTGG
jgi:hypothetical protein